jgi:hypothetical protein
MNVKLTNPITKDEIHKDAKPMAKCKSPHPNGIVVEFYTFF